MNKKKDLLKNTIMLFLGKCCTQFISFFLLPLYTSILTTKDYGLADLITTYIYLLVPVLSLQLESSVFRFLIDKRNDEEEKNRIISSTIIGTLIMIIITILISIIIYQFFKIEYFLLIILNIIVNIFSNVFLQITRGLGDNKKYTVGTTLIGSTNVIFNVIFLVILKYSIEGIFLSSFISNLICIIYLLFTIKIFKYFNIKKCNKKLLKSLLKYSLPLIPNGIAWWVINTSDRTIITLFLGSSFNGIYAVSTKFSNLYINLYNIFHIAWVETASLNINSKDRNEFFTDIINAVLKLFCSICLLAIAILPFIFKYLVNVEYSEAYLYIPILLIATLFNVVINLFSVIYIALKLTKEIMKTSILSAILNIIFNLMFIKILGLYASSLSTLLSFLILMIYRYFNIKKYINLKFDKKFILEVSLIFIIILLMYYKNILIGNIISLIIVIIYSFIINKEILKKIIYLLKKKVGV